MLCFSVSSNSQTKSISLSFTYFQLICCFLVLFLLKLSYWLFLSLSIRKMAIRSININLVFNFWIVLVNIVRFFGWKWSHTLSVWTPKKKKKPKTYRKAKCEPTIKTNQVKQNVNFCCRFTWKLTYLFRKRIIALLWKLNFKSINLSHKVKIKSLTAINKLFFIRKIKSQRREEWTDTREKDNRKWLRMKHNTMCGVFFYSAIEWIQVD